MRLLPLYSLGTGSSLPENTQVLLRNDRLVSFIDRLSFVSNRQEGSHRRVIIYDSDSGGEDFTEICILWITEGEEERFIQLIKSIIENRNGDRLLHLLRRESQRAL